MTTDGAGTAPVRRRYGAKKCISLDPPRSVTFCIHIPKPRPVERGQGAGGASHGDKGLGLGLGPENGKDERGCGACVNKHLILASSNHPSLISRFNQIDNLIVQLIPSASHYTPSKNLHWAPTTLPALITKKACIFALAGLAGPAGSAFHTPKPEEIPLSKQLVSLFPSPNDVCTQNSNFK